MNLLSHLPYEPFNDFFINVESIRYGWMDLSIGANGKSLSYGASYTTEPLNDLLNVAVAIVSNKKIISSQDNWRPQPIGNCFIVYHDLEGTEVPWLFKYENDELTLFIWASEPVDYDTFANLAEWNFNREAIKYSNPDDIPDLSVDLSFAFKGSAAAFVSALLNTIENLSLLPKDGQEDYDGWGFKYSIDNFALLKDWLNHNK